MTEPDFRVLCAQLLQGLDQNRHPEVRYPGHLRLVMAEARTALVQPAPPAPTRDELNDACGPGPTVEEVAAAAERLDDARHIRSRPVPTEQNMDDLAELVLGLGLPKGDGARLIRRALELWGHIPIAPVPIAERLPGPEDCAPSPGEPDSSSWCWTLQISNKFPRGVMFDWVQTDAWDSSTAHFIQVRATHWLPWWAIPIPTTQDSNND